MTANPASFRKATDGLVGTIMALGAIMLFWGPVSALLRRVRGR